MNDYEEMAQPYLKSISQPKAMKLFKVVSKIQSELGLLDLEDYENILIMLIANNNLERKERTWGHKFREHLNNDQETDLKILGLMKQQIKFVEDEKERFKN